MNAHMDGGNSDIEMYTYPVQFQQMHTKRNGKIHNRSHLRIHLKCSEDLLR